MSESPEEIARRIIDAEIVKLISGDRVKLLPYPTVATRLREVMEREDYDLADLAAVIETDQTLSATVLRRANAAAVAAAQPLTSLAAAIQRLGTAELSRVAFAAALGPAVCAAGPLADLRFGAWRDALIAAHLGQVLAPLRKLSPEEAFLCGLLHDFGRTVAVACLEQLLAEHPEIRPLPEAFWVEIVDRYHVELGLVLAAKWKLPPLLTEIISQHHEPPSGAGGHLAITVVVDEVLRLLARHSHVDAALTEISGLSEAERGAVAEAVASLSATVAAMSDFDEQRPPRPVPSHATKPAALPEEAPAEPTALASLVVRVLRARNPVDCSARWMGEDKIVATSPEQLQEGSLVKVALVCEPDSLELWATIQRCAMEDEARVVELRPFALDKETKRRWDRMREERGLPEAERRQRAFGRRAAELLDGLRGWLARLAAEGAAATAGARGAEREAAAFLDALAAGEELGGQREAVRTAWQALGRALEEAALLPAEAAATKPARRTTATARAVPSARRGRSRREIIFIVALVALGAGRLALFAFERQPAASALEVERSGDAMVSTGRAAASASSDEVERGIPAVILVDLVRAAGELRAEAAAMDPDGDRLELSYLWQRDGEVVAGQTTSTLRATAPGSYVVEVAAFAGKNRSTPLRSAPLVIR